MKDYPSIPGYKDALHKIGEYTFCFNKLDGSNLRFQFNKKHGWNKFGSRTRLLDRTDPILGPGIDIFLNKYSEALEKKFFDTREFKEAGEMICFGEFYGPSSFAGTHVQSEQKDVVLFDVNIHKKGLLDPREFIKNFGDLHIPDLIFEGKLTKAFIDGIVDGQYPVVEGAIAKGGSGHKLWSLKIKCQSYLDKLKNTFPKNWEQYI